MHDNPVIDVCVQQAEFDAGAVLQQLMHTAGPHVGALASFVGLVRDQIGHEAAPDQASAQHAALQALHLEHYPGMTEKVLHTLATQACSRFTLRHVVLIHRYGTLAVSEPIVLVIATSANRQQAFDGAQYLMDCLKTDAPFWKCEIDQHGKRTWVTARKADAQKRQQWMCTEHRLSDE